MINVHCLRFNFINMSTQVNSKPVTIKTLTEMKLNHEPISMMTAYDYSMARMVDASGMDVILVGDSAANVMAGYGTTLPITLDQMIYHAASVVRGTQHAMVVVDMPFGTYQGNPYDAFNAAVRMMKETGADALKLEGGQNIGEAISMLIKAGIPVMGHLGLTPQSVHKFGGYGLRAKDDAEAKKLIEDALYLQEIGCFSMVLEKIPADLAAKVSAQLHIPTIGIGAGNGTDGQVLVYQDILGINNGFQPKFLRRYLNLFDTVTTALSQYITDVKSRNFPNENEQY